MLRTVSAQRRVRIATILGAMFVAAGNPAWATPVLPGAASLTESFQDDHTGNSLFFHSASASAYGGSASIDLTSGPTVEASGDAYTMAGAGLNYSFVISGPGAVTSVPINIVFSYDFVGITDSTDNVTLNPTGGSIHLSYSGASPYFPLSINSNDTGATSSGNTNTISATDAVYQTTLPTSTKINVQLVVAANGAGSSAYLDPSFAIDPSFFAANSQYSPSDFTILESSGVANGVQDVTVPEPISASLLLTFVGVASLARHNGRVRR